MLSNAEALRQRRQLVREIAAEHKRSDRAKIAELRKRIRDIKARRREAMRKVVTSCQVGRRTAKQRAAARIAAIRAEARAAVLQVRNEEKQAARTSCDARKSKVRTASLSAAEQRRAQLKAERDYQREIARIEHRARKKERENLRRSKAEERQESDDEVRSNIPPELVPLFERVKRSIKGSTRASRTEAFLQYAEENPDEAVDAQEEISRREIARLIREERALHHAMRSPRRYKATAAELAAVPF